MLQKLIFLLLIFSPYLLFAQTPDSLNSLQELKQFQIEDRLALLGYHTLYTEHKLKLTTKQSLEIIQKGIDASKQFGNDSLLVELTCERSSILIFNLRNCEQATQDLKELETIVGGSYSHQTLAYYYLLLGTALDCVGNSSKAIDTYLKSVDFYKLAKNFRDLPAPLLNISFIYNYIGDYDNAKKYIYEIFPICKKMEEKDGLNMKMAAHLYLCHNFANQENLDSASYHNIKALSIAAKIDTIEDTSVKEACYRAYLAGIQFLTMQGNLEKAGQLVKKVASYKMEKGFLYFMALARYNIERGNYKEAEKMLQQLPEMKDDLANNLYVSELKSDYYKAIGNLSEALQEKDKELEITKKLSNQQRLQYATFANVRYQTIKKEEEIKNLQQSEALEKQKTQLSFLIIILLIALLILGILAYLNIKNKAMELRNIYEQRSKLFTTIAHELRTPLTLISGSIHQIIQSTELKQEDKNLLNLAKESSEDLGSISDQILDLTKSRVGAIQPKPVKFNWSDFLNHHLPKYEIQANRKGVTLTKKLSIEDAWVQTDVEKIKIILDNLFQNAFKFSGESSTVTFQTSDSQSYISFSVQDKGVGIEEKDIPNIFKRYYQSSHDLGGFGVGLAVCKEYIEVLGGSINLKSQKGKGTVVSVTFPKVIQSQQPVKTQTFTPQIIPDTGFADPETNEDISTKILVIEDHEGIRSFLYGTLSKEYNVHFAKNGKEGLAILDSVHPDLIITDWMMPVMNGIQFIEQLRQNQNWHDLPVIMLTAKSFPVDKLKALKKGVDDYLLKPFEVEVLKVRIENLLNLSINRKEYREIFKTEEASSTVFEESDLISKNQKDYEWILNVEEIISTQLQNFDLNVSLLAKETKLSKSHFSRKIKTITGMPPLKFINEVRYWEARKLLEEKQETSVKAVVYSVGLKSIKNFSRNFKKRFGVYPKELLY